MSTCQSHIILGLTLLISIIATVRSGPNVTELQVEEYLSEFGDNKGNSDSLKTIDEQTKKLFLLPRCGVRDRRFRISNRQKRFVAQNIPLIKTNLTYNIRKYPSSLKRHEVDKEIRRAFSVWSEHTPLNFTREYYGIVNFQISFVRGYHADGNDFDGKGKTLAHAFFTHYGGIIHFDADEEWTIGTTRGTNLFQVAVHEIGHALGLDHSDVDDSVMAPFSKPYDANFKLRDDDIAGIQHLYGKRSFKLTALKPSSNIPSLPREPH